MNTDPSLRTMITDLTFEYRGYTVNLYETQSDATPVCAIVSIVRPDGTHLRTKQHRIGLGVPVGSPRFTADYAERIVDRDRDPPVALAQLDLFNGVGGCCQPHSSTCSQRFSVARCCTGGNSQRVVYGARVCGSDRPES